MRLVAFKKLPRSAYTDLDIIVGVRGGKPLVIGKRQRDRSWIVYRLLGQGSLKRENLKRLGRVSSLDKILSYFQDKELAPFCLPGGGNTGPDREAGQAARREVERRGHYRKEVDLPGEYTNKTGESKPIRVVDLSFYGLKFRARSLADVEVGDALSLRFTLDNPQRAEIKRKATVRHKEGSTIGVVFDNPPEYDKDLGFYLMPT